MSDKKISQLTDLPAASVSPSNDVLPIVDTNLTETKKITAKALVDGALNAGTANGLVYLNGSKETTTGSVITYDGTTFKVDDAVVINESGGDNDTRIEGDTDANLFFVDASTDRIGIGTASPAAKLDLDGAGIVRGFLTTTDAIKLGANASAPTSTDSFIYRPADNTLAFGTASAEKARIDPSGNLGLGVTPSASWVSGTRVFQFGTYSAVNENFGGYPEISFNSTQTGSTSFVYRVGTNPATRFSQTNGAFQWYTAPSGTAGNAITFTQAMTLDASGNLGLGATSITALGNEYTTQAIQGANGAGFRLYQSTNERGRFYADSTGAFLQSVTSIPLVFSTDGTERARITSGGDLLVGKTTTSGTSGVGFAIAYDSASPTYSVVGSTSSAAGNCFQAYSTGASAYRFYVDYAGTVFATNTTISAISDQRFKENINDLDVGLDAVMALKPRKFDWKEGKGKNKKDDRGFIAQEFEQVFPDLVDEWKDPAPEGEEPYKSVRQDLIPVLVKAIQEQQAMIEDLKAKVAALEAK